MRRKLTEREKYPVQSDASHRGERAIIYCASEKAKREINGKAQVNIRKATQTTYNTIKSKKL